MDEIETSGKALVEHWKWAADKGLMNINTANALRAACAQVLGVMDDWQGVNLRTLKVDDVCRRFQNKRNKDFKPESLETYKRRFTQAVKSFLEYADDPSAWKPAQERAVRKEKASNGAAGTDAVVQPTVRGEGGAGLVDYPYPLREGRLAVLRLPTDLKLGEVRRLTAYLNTLAVDFDPSSGA